MKKSSIPNIVYTTHQYARFSSCPKTEHSEKLLWLAINLKGLKHKGTILKLLKGDNIDVYVDTDFYGNWDPKDHTDRDTAIYRNVYLINYGRFPILWKPQLHKYVVL